MLTSVLISCGAQLIVLNLKIVRELLNKSSDFSSDADKVSGAGGGIRKL
jgi:hypothetical protein